MALEHSTEPEGTNCFQEMCVDSHEIQSAFCRLPVPPSLRRILYPSFGQSPSLLPSQPCRLLRDVLLVLPLRNRLVNPTEGSWKTSCRNPACSSGSRSHFGTTKDTFCLLQPSIYKDCYIPDGLLNAILERNHLHKSFGRSSCTDQNLELGDSVHLTGCSSPLTKLSNSSKMWPWKKIPQVFILRLFQLVILSRCPESECSSQLTQIVTLPPMPVDRLCLSNTH